MKRRNFIGATAMSLTAILFNKPIVYAQKFIPTNKNLLESFIEEFELVQKEDYWLDLSFRELHRKTAQGFHNSYRSLNERVYSAASSPLVIVPLELHIPSMGSVDWVFLFYEKNKNGQWEYVKTLNKYEVEAILALVHTIANKLPKEQPADWLLPRLQEGYAEDCYFTQKGSVQIVVKLHAFGVWSSAQVWTDKMQIV